MRPKWVILVFIERILINQKSDLALEMLTYNRFLTVAAKGMKFLSRLAVLIYCILVLLPNAGKAQKIDSIYFNLYTDSLKKGNYNYINVEGRTGTGKIIPLDSTYLILEASSGRFYGNSLWLSRETKLEKIDIKVSLRQNPSFVLNRSIYIKKKEED